VLVFVVMLQPFMMMARARHPIAVMTNPPLAIVPYMMVIVIADDLRWARAVVLWSAVRR